MCILCSVALQTLCFKDSMELGKLFPSWRCKTEIYLRDVLPFLFCLPIVLGITEWQEEQPQSSEVLCFLLAREGESTQSSLCERPQQAIRKHVKMGLLGQETTGLPLCVYSLLGSLFLPAQFTSCCWTQCGKLHMINRASRTLARGIFTNIYSGIHFSVFSEPTSSDAVGGNLITCSVYVSVLKLQIARSTLHNDI